MENCYYEQEKRKMYGMLPCEVRRLVPYVENACNCLEYNGSRMFDEYPDARMMEKVCERIVGQINDSNAATKDVVWTLLGFECYARRCRDHWSHCR